MTEEQAAQSLLKKWGFDDDKEPTEPESTEEPEAEESEEDTPDAEEEAEPEESEDEGEENDDVELDVSGEKFKLPKAASEQVQKIQSKLKEAEAGVTRKFQEAAEIRKSAESQVEQAKKLNEFAQKNSKLLTDYEMVNRRLATLSQIDVMALGNTDPAMLAKITAESQQLLVVKGQIESAYNTSAQEFQQENEKARKERFERLDTYAKANVKGWSPERSEELAKFAESRGLSREWLRENLNEGLITLISDAHYAQTVKAAKPAEKREKEPAKALKPGASGQSKTASVKKVDELSAKAKKSGSWEDAANLLLARASAKRR